MRTLTCIAALSAALLMTHSAFAASAVVKACRTDIKAQCGDEMKSGGAALKDCMKKHFSDLSEDCQVRSSARPRSARLAEQTRKSSAATPRETGAAWRLA